MSECVLCARKTGPGGEEVLWEGSRCRVILADEAGFPGFCRVVWNDHVAEMTDLSPADRGHVMSVAYAVEGALRDLMSPDKVNLAALGNMVPHIHWHVVPRFRDDPTFPGSPWSPVQRDAPDRSADPGALRAAIAAALA